MIPELLILGAFVLLAFLYGRYRKDIGFELLIASIISLVWVGLSGLYTYNSFDYTFLGISVFPFILWTTGLVIFKEFSEWADTKCNNPWRYWIGITLVWIITILILEWIGYHWWNIQLTNGDPGILGFDILHLPVWGQIYYLFAGVGFVALGKLWKVK